MKGDFSRIRFNPAKQYTAVLKQQGRVDLDADANEQRAIDLALRQTINTDVIGEYGGPENDAGFAIEIEGSSIMIGPGRYYVHGIQAENPGWLSYDAQPYLLDTANSAGTLLEELLQSAAGISLGLVLEVWQRMVTAIDDPCLLEPALGQADTTARLQTVWRVVGSLSSATASSTDPVIEKLAPCCQALYSPSSAVQHGKMGAAVSPAGSDCGCQPIAAAGYQGLENQLYRVEIHKGGDLSSATFKWSRENAAVVAKVASVGVNSPVITVSSLGPDANLGFQPGQWVELSDDTYQFGDTPNRPGILFQIKSVTPATLQVSMTTPVYGIDVSKNARMRRWDQSGASATNQGIPVSATPVTLENGIQVDFAKGQFQPGDYWTIPARTANGQIDWPPCGGNGSHFQPGGFIRVHSAPIACISVRRAVRSSAVNTTLLSANVADLAATKIAGSSILGSTLAGSAGSSAAGSSAASSSSTGTSSSGTSSSSSTSSGSSSSSSGTSSASSSSTSATGTSVAGATVNSVYSISDCRLLFPALTAMSTEAESSALHVSKISWTNDDVMTTDMLLQNGLSVTFDQTTTCPWGGGNFQVSIEPPSGGGDFLAVEEGRLQGVTNPTFPSPVGTDAFVRTTFALDPPWGITVTPSGAGTQVNWLNPVSVTTTATLSAAGVNYGAYVVLAALNVMLSWQQPIGWGRVRVRLIGGAIYGNGSSGNIYLDGQSFGATATRTIDGSESINYKLPSGNSSAVSDYEGWFYLAPTVYVTSVVIQGTENNQVTTVSSVTVVVNAANQVTGLVATAPAGAVGAAVTALQASITLSYPPVAATTVQLTLTGTGAGSVVTIASSVTLAAGQQSITTPITVLSNPGAGVTDTVTLTASVGTAVGSTAATTQPTLAIVGVAPPILIFKAPIIPVPPAV